MSGHAPPRDLLEVDINPFFAQSVCGTLVPWIHSPMKKALFVVAALVLAPVILVGVVAFAAGDWRQIGSTPAGDQVSVSSVSARKGALRSAWIRIQYKEPMKLPQGGPFVEFRARVHFNCVTGSTLTNPEWFYARDHSGKLVVTKKTRRDDQFGQASEGNFAGMAKDFVCGQK
jgi:hypothetical protein